MFKWPTPPSSRAPRHELADFAELTCWRDNHTSATDLSRLLGRLEENAYLDGVPEEEESDRIVDEAYEEIQRRLEACGSGYPFVIGERGNTLQPSQDTDNVRHVVYKYMLLATRLNMKDNRIQAGIDGTQLFEELAAEVAREYFGDRSKSLVFGAKSDSPSFELRVDHLCDQIKEGGGFVSNDLDDTNVKDGKLDVVVWKPFADGLPGKLIGFGQCKTGTHYRDSIAQLQPDAFCSKWMHRAPAVPPMRMFFVAEALALAEGSRRNMSIDAGLLFDRCRIIDFSSGIGEGVIETMRQWTVAAAEAAELAEGNR